MLRIACQGRLHEGDGDQLRKVADQRHDTVMLFGIQRYRNRQEGLHKVHK